MIDQLTVFLENTEGRLASLCGTMADANINMSALTIAETSEYGLVRIICDEVDVAVKVLEDAGFRATKTKVVAVVLPNKPGSLARLLAVLDVEDINIEYGYCFSSEDEKAIDVLKIIDAEKAEIAIKTAGFEVL